MKKLNVKTIGTLIAVVGSIAAMSTAFALYYVGGAPTDVEIGIGAHTTKDVTLSATNNADDKKALQPGQNRVYDFTLGFSCNTGSLYSQDVYMGKLSVTITASTNDFASYLANSTLAIGTVNTTPEYTGYWAQSAQQPVAQHTASTNTVSFVGHYPIYKTGVKCRLTIGLGSITDANFMSYCTEQTYSISIDFAAADNSYNMCYVRGPWGWTSADQGLMVPNPKSSVENGFQWMYQVSNTSTDPNYIANNADYKCYKEATSGYYENFSGNHQWDSTKSAIYWDGQATSSSSAY